MALKLAMNSSFTFRKLNKYLRKNVKDKSACILRLWTTQCEFVFAQQLRRSQQIFAHYAKIWEERALRELLRRVRGQVQRHAKGFLLSSAALLTFDWERERIELESVQEHMDDFQFLERLQQETIYCRKCEKRKLIDSRVDGVAYCCCPKNVTEMLSAEQNAYTTWEPYIEQKRMITWRQEIKPGLYAYKVYVEYPDVTAEDFLHVQIDVEYRKKWDNTAVNLEVVDEDTTKGSHSHIIYWEALWPKLFANRDYVYNRRYFVDRNRRVIMIVNKSVDHPKCPAKPHTQRVHEYWSYMVIKPTTSFNKPGVSFVLTYFDNPGLSIPKYITTWVAKKQMPDFLHQLHQATVNYAKAKRQNETRIIEFWDKHKDPGFEYPPDTLLGYSVEDFSEAQKQEEESSLQKVKALLSVEATATVETASLPTKSKRSVQQIADPSKPSDVPDVADTPAAEECTSPKKSTWNRSPPPTPTSMGGIKKTLRLAAPKTKQKKAIIKLKAKDSSLVTKTKGPVKPKADKSDRKQKKEPGTKDATREPVNFVSPATPVDDSSDEMETEDDEQQTTKKLPVLEPVPSDVPDPKLPPRLIKMLRPLIGYFYNGDQISLKQSFEQAALLLEPDYDETTKVFRFLVNTKEVCRAVGEKNEAHTEARDKLIEIVRYYCYNLKKVKPYHTRRKIFYTRPPKSVQAAGAKGKQLQDENIGFKMLQKQGWSGGGLGSGESGITEPIAATKRKGKRGLGMENATQEATGEVTAREKIPLEAFYLVIQEYAGVNALYDLVFSSQFAKEQVRMLRDFALRKKLLTQMVGHKKKKLVVSKPLTIKEIKVGVMKGHSDLCAKYVVIPPAAGIPPEDMAV